MERERTERLTRVRLTRQEALAVTKALETSAGLGALRTGRCLDVYLDTHEARLARSATAGRGGMVRAVLRERPGIPGKWLCAEHEDEGSLTSRSELVSAEDVLAALDPKGLTARFPFLPRGLAPVLAARCQRLEWDATGQDFRVCLEADVHAWATRLEDLAQGSLSPRRDAMALSGALLTVVGREEGVPAWLSHLMLHAPPCPDAFHLVWMRARERAREQLGGAR